MKKIIVISVLLTMLLTVYSQVDNIYIDKEYEIEIDTNQLYKQLYHLDSLQTKLGFVYLGSFVGTGLTSIIFKIPTTNLLIPASIIFVTWIGTNIYFRIKTNKIEKQILKAR